MAEQPLIAIVDDDRWMRRSLERLLKAAGLRAEAFISAEHYLAASNHEGTDCMILDIGLPGMSGFELERRLRAEQNRLPIVFVSAHDEPGVRDKAADAGAVAFLGKPFDDNALLDAISSALRLRKVERQDGSCSTSAPGNGVPTALRRINVQAANIIVDDQLGNAEAHLKPFTVLIADDLPIVRHGLATLINRRSDMRVVAEAANGPEAVEKFVAESPDVGLLELRLPGMDGVETVLSICRKVPSARLVIFTACQGEEDIYRALRAGAYGYLFKDAPLSELIRCIRAVGEGGRWIPPAVASRLGKRVADKALTAREFEVLRELTSGKSNKEIGNALNISEATVKVHITHILEKLKVTGRTEAINVAMKRGLVHMDPQAVA